MAPSTGNGSVGYTVIVDEWDDDTSRTPGWRRAGVLLFDTKAEAQLFVKGVRSGCVACEMRPTEPEDKESA